MVNNTGFSIINLRDGGELRLLFPEEINSENRSNWETVDVAGGIKPLSFGNVEPQKVRINDLTIDNTRSNQSVEPDVDTLQSWMKPNDRNGAPPMLQIITSAWQKRVVLTEMDVNRCFFTGEGVCIRAKLSLSFEEIISSGLQIEATTKRRSGNSLSGRT